MINITFVLIGLFVFAIGLLVGFFIKKSILERKGYVFLGEHSDKLKVIKKNLKGLSIAEIEYLLHLIMQRPCRIHKTYINDRVFIDSCSFLSVEEQIESTRKLYNEYEDNDDDYMG